MKILDAYFSSKGRMSRWPYFVYSISLIGVVIPFILLVLFLTKFRATPVTSIVIWGSLSFLIYASTMLNIKRFHDLNKAGWWSIILLVPVIHLIAYVLLLLFKGTAGPNRFGNPDQREVSKEPLGATNVLALPLGLAVIGLVVLLIWIGYSIIHH